MLLFFGLGCTQPLSAFRSQTNGTPTPNQNQTGALRGEDHYDVPLAQPKIDILFVVDNSGSMADEQAQLQATFADFISGFLMKDLDFHVGIVTTDVTPTSQAGYWSATSGAFQGYQDPGPGKLLSRSNSRYLTPTTPNLVSRFAADVAVGTSGSSYEQGLQSIYETLAPERLGSGGANAGFIRDDAMLSLVVISDEDECIGAPTHSGSSADSAQMRIDRMLARVQGVKGASAGAYRFDFALNLNQPPTGQTYPSVNLLYPQIYLLAAAQLMSTPFNVASDFSDALVALGDDLSTHVDQQYALSFVPLDDTLTVEIDGQPVAHDALDGYTYLPPVNRIQLNGAALQAVRGHHLTIGYDYLP
ncbi:MAG: vWA domain-containing protein [Bacteriovoracia bacterium]